MGDSDLEELRQKRMAQLRAQYGQETGDMASKQEAEQERQEKVNDMKNSILSQILDQGARARLNTLMLGKPEKGRMVESMLVQMAQRGQVGGKISETELIGILESINQQTSRTTTVKFDRRRAALDSDDDL